MKATNLETIRIKNGISICEILKSIVNENNFTDEDIECEIPTDKKQTFFQRRYYYQEYSK